MADTASGQPKTRVTGLCRYDDPDKWFPRHPVPRARVIRICNNCPFQPQCAQAALELAETDGVWAGVQLPGDRAEDSEMDAARDKLHKIAVRPLPPPEFKRRSDIAAAMRFVAAEQRKFAQAWNDAHDENHRRRAITSRKEQISA
ncbi:WhiB family transcriptional regulator [Mycolicibacterium wolinskyi]|uniref:WhiB family transcriptional regulator n=1 Tax=Mycolicibacterium wolinskyi TaxID=59750 RepID=UPI00082FAD77|nr:WhiB family transcriptional regulator [Mycolicibacterium wolinskyi]